jgi:pyridoxine/pyridoxamine 5'-phosphate oxidase
VTDEQELGAQAREIVDSNRYMVLGTADANGLPWVTPVWFATEDYRAFLWVSRPEARHSLNLAARPELSIVVFDSQVPVGGAKAVYMSGVADEVTGAEIDPGIGIFSRESEAQGLPRWTRENVVESAPLRLYRADVAENFVLGPGDRRLPVSPVSD